MKYEVITEVIGGKEFTFKYPAWFHTYLPDWLGALIVSNLALWKIRRLRSAAERNKGC